MRMCLLCIPQIQNLVKVTSGCGVSHTNIKNTQLHNVHYTNVIQNSLYTANNFIMSHISKVQIPQQKKKKGVCI